MKRSLSRTPQHCLFSINKLMAAQMILRAASKNVCTLFLLLFACLQNVSGLAPATTGLSALKRDQSLRELRVSNLYCDTQGKIVGVKLWHVPTGAPVFLFQIETVPQAFM